MLDWLNRKKIDIGSKKDKIKNYLHESYTETHNRSEFELYVKSIISYVPH